MIEQILNPEILTALGWTLIHSLWQVAAVAVLLALVLLILRKSSARLRYNIAISSLLISFCLFVGTFGFYYFNVTSMEMSIVFIDNNTEIAALLVQNDLANTAESNGIKSNYTIVFYDYFNTHLPVIVTLWFLGLTLFVIRLLGGLAYVQRLKHSNHNRLSEEWEIVLEEVKTKLKIDKVVDLVESSLVNVPMVIGYLKPMILMPIGAINYLTVEEVEAIFAHELAHIKRYDYFVNLLQSIIETILFYHPVIWWISSEIRRERENCCDDLALEITGNSLTLAKALAKLEQFRMNFINRKIQLSMTALKNKNQLLQRIQRILKEPQSNNSTLKGLFAGIILVVCFFTTSLDAQEKPIVPTALQLPKVETIIPIPKPNLTEVKAENIPQKVDFPEILNEITESSTPVVPVFPIEPIEPVQLVLPEMPVLPIQHLKPVVPVAPINIEPFDFRPKSAVNNTSDNVGVNKIYVHQDTSIDGKVKEIIVIKEVKEANSPTKEVKISIKKGNGKDEITVYENGRKLSKEEAEKYAKNFVGENRERELEMKRLEREMQAEQRKMQAKQRTMMAEERKMVDEERKRLAEQRFRMEEEMKESRKKLRKEVETMKKERAIEIEKLVEEHQEIQQEKKRLSREQLEKVEQKRKLKIKEKSTLRNSEKVKKSVEMTSNTRTTTSSSSSSMKNIANNNWFDDFVAVLKKDGILKENSDNLRIKMSEDFIRVNGKKLTKAEAKKYYQLYEKLSGSKINGEVEIRKSSSKF
jgi:beta-lactamase regulating signal transducer with metallopeptidase domain